MTTTTTSTTETHDEETNQPIMAKSAERLPGTSTRLRTRDDGCCSVNFLKYVLHIYNVVLFVSDVKPRGLMHYTRVTSSEIAKWRGVSALTDDCFTFPLAIGRVLSNVMSFRSRKPPPPHLIVIATASPHHPLTSTKPNETVSQLFIFGK